MAFYIPSFIQKRILRYALSKFDIFDADALQPDRLDIAWGKRSSFELRDVGLRIDRLAELLKLPPHASIRSAKIALLRLTIPADIYVSGIKFEAEGLYLDLFLDAGANDPAGGKGGKGTGSQPAGKGSPSARSPHPRAHDPGGDAGSDPNLPEEPENSSDPAVPAAEALARSYLAAEPAQEKARLKEALAKSQHIDQSQFSESDDSETGDGFGAALSLPLFVADFLEGVKDRAHASVKDICVDFSTLLDLPTGRGSQSGISAREQLRLRLSIGELLVPPAQVLASPDSTEGDGPGPSTRSISVKDIRAALLSDPSLFDILAQQSGPSSPVMTHQSSLRSNPRSSSHHGLRRSGPPSPEFLSNLTGSLPSLAEPDSSPPESLGRSEEDESPEQGVTSTFDALPSLQVRPSVHEDVENSQASLTGNLLPEGVSPTNSDSPSQLFYSHMRSSERVGQGSRSDEEPDSPEAEFHSQPSSVASSPRIFNEANEGLGNTQDEASPLAASIGPGSDLFNSFTAEDAPEDAASSQELLQSRIFSHEEAASLYESAISTGPAREPQAMPGGWRNYSPVSMRRSETTTTESTERDQEGSVTPLESHQQEAGLGQDAASQHLMNSTHEAVGSQLLPESPEGPRPTSDDTRVDEGPSEREDSHKSDARHLPSPPGFPDSTRRDFFHIDGIAVKITEKPSAVGRHLAETLENLRHHRPMDASMTDTVSSSVFSTGASGISPAGDTSATDAFGDDSDCAVSYSIDIGRFVFTSDLSLVRLSVLAFQQLSLPATNKIGTEHTPVEDQNSYLKVSIGDLQWRFVTAINSGLLGDDAHQHVSLDPGTQEEVLLELRLQKVTYAKRASNQFQSQRLTVGTFAFGYANEPILSFDSSARMRESVRDNLAPAGDDIKMSIMKKNGMPTDITMATAPLCVRLDLGRLDELFTWFGGLSSVLELGGSMVSTMTVPETTKSKRPKKTSQTRGVRFEAESRERSPSPGPGPGGHASAKFTARIGGLSFVIIGSESAFSIDSSAIKIAQRKEAVRVSIDRIRATGPYNSGPRDEAVPTLWLEVLTLMFLPAPTDDDLDRVLALLSPSKDHDEPADDILLDTFLRQRRQGSILRIAVKRCSGNVDDIEQLDQFSVLANDLKKLSTVAKYLPDDDRPGLLILTRIDRTDITVDPGHSFGTISLGLDCTEIAEVTLPSLFLLGVGSYQLRLRDEEQIGSVIERSPKFQGTALESPMLTARMIGDEMEPTLKLALWNARIEYKVSTLVALQKLFEDIAGTDGSGVKSSLATLQDQEKKQEVPSLANSQASSASKTLKFKVAFRDSALGLNPTGSPAKALLLLQNADLEGSFPSGQSPHISCTLTIKRMTVMLVDDAGNLVPQNTPTNEPLGSPAPRPDAALALLRLGYVNVSDISAAKILFQSQSTGPDEKCIEIEIHDELLVVETCADSTQTLITVFGGLSPPSPPSTEIKYRTQIVPMRDMLASFHGSEIVSEPNMPEDEELDYDEDDIDDTLSLGDSFHDTDQAFSEPEQREDPGPEELGLLTESQLLDPGRQLRASGKESQVQSSLMDESLVFDDDHFGDKLNDAEEKHRWNSSKNAFEPIKEREPPKFPFQLRVRDVHFIWNLFDGYDWNRTRDTISQAVADLEAKVAEAQAKKDRRRSFDYDEHEDPVIGDFLFNSIYIGVGVNQTPRDIAHGINRNIDDLISETASQTTGVTSPKSSSPSRFGGSRPRRQRLRLKRSRHHKMTFELKGISVDFTVQPPGSGETQSSVDVRVRDLDIFDHVPTSTWKKFATYMHDAGERESGSNMAHIELLTVRPVPELEASELVLRARVLPLRLHVDQDALDFLTRFFEFKAEPAEGSAPPGPATEVPFIQRAEVAAIPLKLDFKPKRVDYAGLRSGRTTEFMNFIVLEAADMVLRRVIVYGICGFDRLGITLNDIWMPDVRSHQLRGVLAGLAPVRPLVNVGAGVRDLIVVPVREYRKDGRVMRAVGKGAAAFAKTTTTELAKLGVKLAVGTQTALQTAESALVPVQQALGAAAPPGDQDPADPLDESALEETPVFSPYADPPLGVVQGLRGAYRQLERDLLLARDAVVAMPAEVLESGSAGGAARAVLRGAPTVILRPALGVSKAVGTTLMGATASLDPGERRRIDDKYKKRG